MVSQFPKEQRFPFGEPGPGVGCVPVGKHTGAWRARSCRVAVSTFAPVVRPLTTQEDALSPAHGVGKHQQ